MTSPCGWCLVGDHARHRPGGEATKSNAAWRCDCERCVMVSSEPPARTGLWMSASGSAARWVFCCPKCYWGRNWPDVRQAELAQARHVCRWEARKGEDMKSLLEQGWEKLDATMDRVVMLNEAQRMEPTPDGASDLRVARLAARQQADLLALWTFPHYRSADEVIVHATERWAARRDGRAPETLGLVGES